MQPRGIGPTTASAIVATVGKDHDFTCGRQFCAWLGLVPGPYSSGGKQRLGRLRASKLPRGQRDSLNQQAVGLVVGLVLGRTSDSSDGFPEECCLAW